MNKKVKVIAAETDEVLFETDIENIENAYEYAAQMDEIGIAVRLVAPTIADTLSTSLGLTVEENEKLQTSIIQELEDHDGSCCAKPFDPNTDKLQ